MQILISNVAHGRIAERLNAIGDDFDLLLMDQAGQITRLGGATVPAAEIDPEIFWLSLDMVYDKTEPALVEQIMKGSKGRWMQVVHAGIDRPSFRALMAKGLRLSKGNAQAPAIAEFVIAQAISVLHPIDEQRRAQAAREWRAVPFREIGSTRWLLVGFGSIGQEIARRVGAFGASIAAIRRNRGTDPLVSEIGSMADLPRLLPDADVVVLACALNDQTRGMADAGFFAALKTGSILVNIGRGGLIDEQALRSALDQDQPAHAALDVFNTEPLPADSWFWSHPKVSVTAHTAYFGDGIARRSDQGFLENLRRYRLGEPLLNEARPFEVGL